MEYFAFPGAMRRLHKRIFEISIFITLGIRVIMVFKAKPGKVTIPFHSGDIPKRVIHSILKQASIK
jgi:hypothetical protein